MVHDSHHIHTVILIINKKVLKRNLGKKKIQEEGQEQLDQTGGLALDREGKADSHLCLGRGEEDHGMEQCAGGRETEAVTF